LAWIEELKGKRIALDTSPMIYYLEEKPDYVGLLDPLFDMLDEGKCSMVTSVITLLEGLVIPMRTGDSELARKWHDFLYTTDNFTTVDISPQIAEKAARIRAAFPKIKTPDAVQVATAIVEGAAVFLTNDIQLALIPDIKVLVLNKLKLDS
jgi:predicted nucleic acid-binding protein